MLICMERLTIHSKLLLNLDCYYSVENSSFDLYIPHIFIVAVLHVLTIARIVVITFAVVLDICVTQFAHRDLI